MIEIRIKRVWTLRNGSEEENWSHPFQAGPDNERTEKGRMQWRDSLELELDPTPEIIATR